MAHNAKLKLSESGALEIRDANESRTVASLNGGGSRETVCIWKPFSRVFIGCDETITCGHNAMRFQCDGNLAFLKYDPATGQWPPKKVMNVSGTFGKGGNLLKKDELTMEM